MTTIKVSADGQITLGNDILRALGVAPGDHLDVETLPDGSLSLRRSASVRRSARTGSMDQFIGVLQGKATGALSLDEMNDVVDRGWAGER